MRRGNQGPSTATSKPESVQDTHFYNSLETESASLLGSESGSNQIIGTRAQNAVRNVAILGDSLMTMAWYMTMMPVGSVDSSSPLAWFGAILPLLMFSGAASSYLAPNSQNANNFYLGARSAFYGFGFLLWSYIASNYVFPSSPLFPSSPIPNDVILMIITFLGMSFLGIPIWRRFRRHELTESLPMNIMFSDQTNARDDRPFKKE